MASEWVETVLGELVEAGDAHLQTGPFGTILKAAEYSAEGVPLISVGEVRQGHFEVSDKTPRVSKETTKRLPKFILEIGDIVFGRKGGIDRNAIVRPQQRGWFLGSDGIRLRLSEKYSSLFFSYQMRSPATRAWLLQHCEGTTMPSLNQQILGRVPIVLPPLPEQKAIAHTLGTLDDKIELNRRMNETLEAIARAIFKSWFVDFDPVRAKASGEAPESICRRLGLTPDHLALFPDRLVDSELGEIPEGWQVSTLGDHIEIFDSKRIPLSNRERGVRRGQYPYYGAASVMDYIDDYIFDGIYVLMGEDGSVVNEDGTPVTQYVWGKFWVNNHAHVLRTKAPMASEHLLLMLKQTNIAPFVTGAVQAKLSQGNLRLIPFVSASARIVEEFAKLIVPLFNLMRSREEETRTLANTRDALLPKLLSGELKFFRQAEMTEVV